MNIIPFVNVRFVFVIVILMNIFVIFVKLGNTKLHFEIRGTRDMDTYQYLLLMIGTKDFPIMVQAYGDHILEKKKTLNS